MKIPRPEYPRPRMVRDEWMNLNGKWRFCFDFGDSGRFKELWKEGKTEFDREIVISKYLKEIQAVSAQKLEV